ncbi:hypothetical protein L1Q48_25255, partial [Klebsiella pneumoniae]
MKRVLASVQAAATLNKLYDGSPVSLTAISKESKLSTSYLEQIFKKLRVKWFTEFGHLNRGDMLTSEQHRCHNEKKKF